MSTNKGSGALFLLLLSLGLIQATAASAQTANLAVSATVQRTCTISAEPVTFGEYTPLSGAALDTVATVTVRCTRGAAVTITLNDGSNADGVTRRMRNADGEFLPYELYRNSSRNQRWGSTPGEGVVHPAANFNPAALVVYGRIPAGLDVPAGSYADTVIATINF